MNLSKYPKARIFETHGVEFSGRRGNQLYGYCPFSEKEDKFYVNHDNWLWDSKTASLSGNIPQFLELIHEDYVSAVTPELSAALSRHRKLPPDAFKQWRMGWNGERYVFPVRDVNGAVGDLRMYHMGYKQMRSTTGCSVGLMGAHRLGQQPGIAAYICEGEWDAIALHWLMKQLKISGVVLASPGAGIFKKEWVPWLTGRRVTVLYDNDEAGRRGERQVHQRLSTSVKGMAFTHWPEELPDGFDVRDWVVYGIKKGTLQLCWDRLQKLFKKSPRMSADPTIKRNGKTFRLIAPKDVQRERPSSVPTLQDVHATYAKWLHLPNFDAVDVVMATAYSQKMDGPPVWMFLVGSPGTAKTATLAGLIEYPDAYNQSSLTAHSLISGANWQGQSDPSLIPRLNNKVLVIKDFTAVLGMRDSDKEEIFGILRDAYDGRCGKVFGNGVERSYESRFTVVAGVTPEIYSLGSRHNALGERFLKFSMGDNLHHEQEEDVISKAIENIDRDTRMKEEIAKVTGGYLQYGLENMKAAELTKEMHDRIVALAQFGARLRGTVSRDMYNGEMMMGKPFAEVGTRLGIQLAKIARALATVRGKTHVTDEEYRLIKRIMIDTVSQRSEDIVRCIFRTESAALAANDIATQTRYPMTTIRRVLDDLNLLKVVRRHGGTGSGFRQLWALTPYVSRCIAVSQVYRDPPQPRLTLRRR
jgi:hypothetical protein